MGLIIIKKRIEPFIVDYCHLIFTFYSFIILMYVGSSGVSVVGWVGVPIGDGRTHRRLIPL